MKFSKAIAAVIGFALAPTMASAGVIGGTYYAPEYDYGEFFWVADHHDFKVVLAGNPFPDSAMGSERNGLGGARPVALDAGCQATTGTHLRL
jgi:hypothetical protein